MSTEMSPKHSISSVTISNEKSSLKSNSKLQSAYTDTENLNIVNINNNALKLNIKPFIKHIVFGLNYL